VASAAITPRSPLSLSKEIINAVMDARAVHTTTNKQAIGFEKVRGGVMDILLGPAQLYEALRDRAGEQR
jgi:type I restriction enzyme R subunit